VLEMIRDRCRAAHGTAPALLHPLPVQFNRSPPREPRTDDEIAVAEALQRLLSSGPA
jgi:hypothetical protein